MTTTAAPTRTPVGEGWHGERAFLIHAGVTLALTVLLVIVWAVTWRGYFWPGWALIALGIPVLIHGTVRSSSTPQSRCRS